MTGPGGYAKMPGMNHPRKIFICAAILVLIVAGYFRFIGLETKAIHHDESVNYSFIQKVPQGEYRYNHTAYHGPLLYFAGYPAIALFGYSKTTLRCTPALAGFLAVLLALLTAKSFGRSGALFFAAALALSPADVYFSKTFIHEIYLGLALVGTIWTLFEVLRTHQPWALVLFYLFWIIGFTAKETTAINVAAFGGALAIGWLVMVYLRREHSLPVAAVIGAPHYQSMFWAIGLGSAIWILMFSSFLRNPQGLVDFFKAYLPWFETGVKEKAHVKKWPYFLTMVPKYYWPAVPFAVWATLHAALGRWFRWWIAPVAAAAGGAAVLLAAGPTDWRRFLVAAVLLPVVVAWGIDAWNYLRRPGSREWMIYLSRFVFLIVVLGGLALTVERAEAGQYGFLLPWLALWCYRLFRQARMRTILLFGIFGVMIAAYSIIPYKTPWCILTMGIALLALGADGVTDAWSFREGVVWRGAVVTLAGLLLFHYGWQSFRVNFWEYDFDHRRGEGNGYVLEMKETTGESERVAVPPVEGDWLARQADYLKNLYNPRYRSGGGYDFIYVQTLREYEQLYDDLTMMTDRLGLGLKASVAMTRGKRFKGKQQPGSKNPARFYLRDYSLTLTLTEDLGLKDENAEWPDFVIVHEDEMRRFNKKHAERYREYGIYPVFPGWKVHLMVRDDLWRKIQESEDESRTRPS